jgi:hypothetical protein
VIKKILIGTSALLILNGCSPAAVSQMAQMGGGLMGGSPMAPTQNTAQTAALATTASAPAMNQLPVGCIARNAGGSASFTQMITEKVVSLAINSALESVTGNKEVKIPAKITNTCEADKRLAYLKKLTEDFSKDIDSANQDILASVEQTKEVQKLQAEIDHKKKTLDEAQYNGGVTEDNEKTLALIKDAKIIDKKKYSAAMGKLALATPISGYMIVGWDKEILEFAKDNMIWGIQNVGAIKDVASQLTTTIKVLPTLASLTTSPLYDGRVDQTIAKKEAAKAIKDDAAVAAKAEEENGFGDA